MGVIETSGSPSLRSRLRGLRGRREGNLPAALYRDNLPAIIRTLRRLGVAEADLPDVAQEVFIVAVRKREELLGVASPRAWLFSVARRVASNHRRKNKNRLSREASWASAGPPNTRPQPELELDLESFLDTLSERDREAFVLGQLEGMTRSELAEALDLAEGTAYSRLRRARTQLERFFADEASKEDAVLKERGHHERALPALLLLLPPELIEGSAAPAASAATASWGLSHVATGFAATLAVALPAVLIAARPEPRVLEAPPPVTTASAVTPQLPPPAPVPQPSLEAEAEAASVVVAQTQRPKAEAPRARKPRPQSKATPLPSQADESAQASALKVEVRLMAEARAALAKGDRRKADASLRRLRAERPRPSLAEEAEALYTEYACRYQSEARGAGSFVAFTTRFPRSAYAKSLASVCPPVTGDDQ